MRRAIAGIRERLLDGADLIIDFATLGEYGLEPAAAEPLPEPCVTRVRSTPVRFGEAVARFERAATQL